MTATEIREHFNAIIERVQDPDEVARLEIAREFFTNEQFRRNLGDHVWESLNGKEA